MVDVVEQAEEAIVVEYGASLIAGGIRLGGNLATGQGLIYPTFSVAVSDNGGAAWFQKLKPLFIVVVQPGEMGASAFFVVFVKINGAIRERLTRDPGVRIVLVTGREPSSVEGRRQAPRRVIFVADQLRLCTPIGQKAQRVDASAW